MKCDKCGKNIANTHIRSVINGRVTNLNLCSDCAAINGIGGLGASLFGEAKLNSETGDKTCSSCGTKLLEIIESGFIGCADCYKIFNKELSGAIRRLHGRTNYRGKIPQTSAPRLDSSSIISKLRKEMSKAVETENFERAAELRDKIKEIEGE